MKTPTGVVVTALPPRRPVPSPVVRPTRFEVSLPPPQLRGAGQRSVIVEERSPGWWAVYRDDGRCLNLAGGWDPEPAPDQRTDLWLRRHRFDLHTAVHAAVQALPQAR